LIFIGVPDARIDSFPIPSWLRRSPGPNVASSQRNAARQRQMRRPPMQARFHTRPMHRILRWLSVALRIRQRHNVYVRRFCDSADG
jgi:hypothetical protein